MQPDPAPSTDDGLFRREAIEASGAAYGRPARPFEAASWILTLFLTVTFIVVVVFLCTAKYARKETVAGIIVPAAGAIHLAVTRPGVLTAVYVREGDTIEAGAPVARLQYDAVTTQGDRLSTVLVGASDEQQEAVSERLEANGLSLREKTRELDEKRRSLLQQQERLTSEVALQKRRIDLNSASLEAARPLREKGYFSELQFRQREEAVVAAQQNLSMIERQAEEGAASLVQLEAARRQLGAEAKQAAAEMHASAAQIREKRASYAADGEALIVAPRSGQLASLRATPGAAVSGGSTVAVIVPEGGKLEAQLWAPSRALGFIRPGDEVRLMYDAFPYQRFGMGRGHVVSVANAPTSPAELADAVEAKEALYRITVALDRQSVRAYGKDWRLSPGSRLSADLILETRSFVDWLFDPLQAVNRRMAP